MLKTEPLPDEAYFHLACASVPERIFVIGHEYDFNSHHWTIALGDGQNVTAITVTERELRSCDGALDVLMDEKVKHALTKMGRA